MGFDQTETGKTPQSNWVAAVLRHPSLWFEGLRAFLATRHRRGLRPSSHYVAWRQFTAYGGEATTTGAHDLLEYLQWRRGMRKIRKWEREA